MADLFKSKEHEFYIDLNQERYFFPGEDISGDIVLDLTKITKVNHIKVVLDGFVELGGRTISLFSKYVLIAQSPEGEKSHHLEAHTHRFPFMITIPTSEECNVPSTLEINKLVKVSYRITAILNKPFIMLEKLSASTTSSITVLEKINVKSDEYHGDINVEKELYLTGTERPVKVYTVIGKRAAVKGDVIPISVTIEHIGVMVRDRAISVQLLRSVYYGRNNTELFGPKILKEVTANIEISGPVSFTKTFPLKLSIPKDTCPTVDKSGKAFKIEYTLRVSVNLNEENPYREEIPQDVVLFNVPFTVGTCPKVSFNIDDDDDDDDDEALNNQHIDDNASNHSSEFDEVTKTMKDLDLGLVQSPVIQQDNYTPLPALSPSSKPTYIPPPMMKQPPRPISIKKDALNKPDKPSSPSNEVYCQVPMVISKSSSPTTKPLERLPSSFENPGLEYAINSGGSTSPIKTSPQLPFYQSDMTPPPEHAVTPSSPYKPKTNISPLEVYNDYNPGLSPTSSIHRNDSVKSTEGSASTSTTDLGRKESFRWIVRNQEAQVPVSPVISNFGTSIPSSTGFHNIFPPRPTPSTSTGYHHLPPPQPTPSTSNHTHNGFFAQPTPSVSNHTGCYNGFPPQPTPNYQYPPAQQGFNYPQQGYNGMPEQGYNGMPEQGYNGMPEPQNNYQYNQYNQYNQQPSHNMPVPQYGMGMPSHQNYQPQPQQSSYPYYHNN